MSGQYILSSAINKKERKTWKVQCGSSKWNVYYTVYEKDMDITLWIWSCQNKLFYVMAVLAGFICFCAFKIWFEKNSICNVSFLLVLQKLLFLSLIHLAFTQHFLEQSWSNPICYVLTGAADLSWDTLISNQVWNCDCVVLEILMDYKF